MSDATPTSSRSELIVAVVVGVISLSYLYTDSLLPSVKFGDPLGPRVFPTLVGLGLLLSAILLVVETYRKQRRAPAQLHAPVQQRAPADEKPPVSSVPGYAILAGVIVWTIAYFYAFDRVGYCASTAVYMFGLLSFFNPRKHVTNAILAICFPAVVDFLFVKELGVFLPSGLIGF